MNYIKKILPKSLFGRFLLIILVPNIIIQAVAIYMFYDRHWESVSKHMTSSLAGDIATIVLLTNDQNIGHSSEITNMAITSMDFSISFSEKEKLNDITANTDPSLNDLRYKLSTHFDNNTQIQYAKGESAIITNIQMPDGVLTIESSSKRLINPSTYIFIMWMTGTALVFILIAIMFMRNQVRSIGKLAQVAEKFGKGIETGSFKPSGATEVKKAARAFIEMKNRIKKQIHQRTEMLAGVSHDLKTPLTRIKLQLAMMNQSKEIKALQEDISDMEKMISEYLDFAKGNERKITSSVNVSDLLRSIISGYRHQHHNIDLKSQSGINIAINANNFRRAINNLIDNALRFADDINITAKSTKKNLVIIVDDNGPGIPAKKRDLVFKPFYRIDSSRNQNKDYSGTGLGLSITKDIVTGYGGNISLEKSPLGGLRVIIKLPL